MRPARLGPAALRVSSPHGKVNEACWAPVGTDQIGLVETDLIHQRYQGITDSTDGTGNSASATFSGNAMDVYCEPEME